MGYSGTGAAGSDFAFGSVGVLVLTIKEDFLEKQMKTVQEKEFPEQSIVSSLVCLRLIGEQFPNALRVHFGKRDFQRAREAFYEWYEKAKARIPKKYRDGVLEEAENEFCVFEERIFGGSV